MEHIGGRIRENGAFGRSAAAKEEGAIGSANMVECALDGEKRNARFQ